MRVRATKEEAPLRMTGLSRSRGDRACEAAFAACDLQTLGEFAGAHEQHAPPVLNESKPMAAARCSLTAQVGRTRANWRPFRANYCRRRVASTAPC